MGDTSEPPAGRFRCLFWELLSQEENKRWVKITYVHRKSSHQFQGLSSTATPVQGPWLCTESSRGKPGFFQTSRKTITLKAGLPTPLTPQAGPVGTDVGSFMPPQGGTDTKERGTKVKQKRREPCAQDNKENHYMPRREQEAASAKRTVTST